MQYNGSTNLKLIQIEITCIKISVCSLQDSYKFNKIITMSHLLSLCALHVKFLHVFVQYLSVVKTRQTQNIVLFYKASKFREKKRLA